MATPPFSEVFSYFMYYKKTQMMLYPEIMVASIIEVEFAHFSFIGLIKPKIFPSP